MKNKSSTKDSGFTLVELAIVLMIIGLLIGGILRGQELMNNARVTSTIQQSKAYTAAVHTFASQYNGLPGDLINAGLRIPNCTGNCAWNDPGLGTTVVAKSGDNMVGKIFTDKIGTASYSGSSLAYETTNFWTHLKLTHLIGDVKSDSSGSSSGTWQNVFPIAKIGGNFHIRYLNIPVDTGIPAVNGHFFLMLPSTAVDSLSVILIRGTAGQSLTTPGRALQIDRKLDDGLPLTGDVISVGTTACEGTASNNAYDPTVDSLDCNVLIRL